MSLFLCWKPCEFSTLRLFRLFLYPETLRTAGSFTLSVVIAGHNVSGLRANAGEIPLLLRDLGNGSPESPPMVSLSVDKHRLNVLALSMIDGTMLRLSSEFDMDC